MVSPRPPITLALIVLSVLAYLATRLFDPSLLYLLLISQSTQPALAEIHNGEVWRLVTPIFLHFSLFHIVFNLLWVWLLGQLIEARQGAFALIILTALIAIASNLAQFYASGPMFGGMSAVVYGYFGYLWIHGLVNPSFGIRLAPQIIYLLLGWFVVCWSGALEIFGVQVANIAHSVGLLTGIVLAFVVAAYYRVRK